MLHRMTFAVQNEVICNISNGGLCCNVVVLCGSSADTKLRIAGQVGILAPVTPHLDNALFTSRLPSLSDRSDPSLQISRMRFLR